MATFVSKEARAYEFVSPESAALVELVADSLGNAPWVMEGELPVEALHAEEIERRFLELPRAPELVEDMLEIKYLLQHWRAALKPAVLGVITGSPRHEDRQAGYAILRSFGVLLTGEEFGRVQGSFTDASDREMAEKELFFAKTPYRDDSIEYWRRLETWQLNDWAGHPYYSDYIIHGDEVHYKGTRFRSGDLLLVDLMSDSAGLFSVFSTPRHYLTHFSMVIIFERGGKRYPAVIETFGKGVRAVPLREYLESYISYGEVYRLKDVPDGWFDRINRLGQRFLYEPHSYDFYARDDNDTNLTCAEVGNALFRRTGLPETPVVSRVPEEMKRNLVKLGFDVEEVLMPTDYAVDSRFERVAVIDKGGGSRNVIRQLVISSIGRLFIEEELDLRKLGIRFAARRWGAGMISRPGAFGGVLRWANGYNSSNYPVGPAELMAIGGLFIAETQRAVQRAASDYDLYDRIKRRDVPLSFHDTEADEQVRETLKEASQRFRERFFRR